jgi:hypothetical protein
VYLEEVQDEPVGQDFTIDANLAERVEMPVAREAVDAKSALNANHTASRTKLASHAQRANDVPVNFS